MTESINNFYNEIRKKLDTLNNIKLSQAANEDELDEFRDIKINFNRLNEKINLDTIENLPNEAIIILINKLDQLITNCRYLRKNDNDKSHAVIELNKFYDALDPDKSIEISRNGVTYSNLELQNRVNRINNSISKLNENIQTTIFEIKRSSEEIYYIYCVLLEQTKSPIRAFLSHSMENFYKSRTLDFESQIKKFNDLHNSHIEELEDQYSSLFERFKILDRSLLDNVQDYQKIQEAITNFNLKIDKEIKDIGKKYETRIDNLSEKFRDIIIKEDETLSSEAKKITDAHSDFIKIVENAGIYSLTENYSQKATEEKKEYKAYRKYTSWSIIAAIVTTIIILGIPIVEYWGINPPVNTNYFTIIARLTVSVMFFVLAVYLSKQAGKHYECYQENHKTFLQLAALEPFISRMSDEDKLEIRKTLVPIYFNQDKDGKFSSKGDEVDLPTNISSLMGKLVDLVGEKKEPKSDDNPPAAKPQS